MQENQRKDQEMRRNKTLVLAGVAILAVAFTLVAIAFSGNSVARGADDCTPKATIDQQIQESETLGPGMALYENEGLGMRFIYPEGYSVLEVIDVEDVLRGEVLLIEVMNEAEEVIFSISATSEDFAISSNADCCYFLSGEIDMSGTVREIQDAIELHVGDIFLPMKASINEKQALAFYYASEDTRTHVASAYAISLTHETYSSALIRSGALYSQNGTYAKNENKISALFEDDDAQAGRGVPLLDNERESEFMEIVKSIQWE